MKKGLVWILAVFLIMAGSFANAEQRIYPTSLGLAGDGGRAIVVEKGVAYVAMKDHGVTIADVSNPAEIRELVTIDLDDYIWSVAIKENLLFAVGNQKIHVLDVRDPASPVKLCEAEGVAISDKGRSQVTGDLLAVFGQRTVGLYDVSDAKQLRLLSKIETANTVLAGWCEVDTLYFADGTDLMIYDISEPAAPVVVSTTACESLSYTEDMLVDENLLYAGSNSGASRLTVLDVEDPFNVQALAVKEVKGGIRSVEKDGDILWALGSGGVLTSIDVSNLEKIKFCGTFTGTGTSFDMDIEGGNVYMVSKYLSTYSDHYDGSSYPVPEVPDSADLQAESDATFLDQSKYDIAENRTAPFETVYEVKRAESVTGEWKSAPVIFSVTDAVKKGGLVSFYGEGLTEGCRVYFAPTSAEAVCEKPSDAIEANVVGYDEYEQMITVIVPEGVEGATYTAYIENEYGVSLPIAVNIAYLDWLDRDQAVAGSAMRVLGENLDAREFGGELATTIVLVSETGAKVYPDIISINPFCVEISIPADMPLGTYKAYVTNDGVRWTSEHGETTLYESYTRVEIIAEDDPYGTGIPWADQYNWDRVFDVTKEPYNLTGEGLTDDTVALQRAIDDAHNAGGGVVYLPAGKYQFYYLAMNSNVVLMGDGMDETQLVYTYQYPEKLTAIAAKGEGKTVGKYGFLNLTVTLNEDPAQGHPDIYFGIGMDFGAHEYDVNKLQPQYLFMKGVKLDVPLEKRGDGRGLGAIIIASDHVWIEDTIMYGINGIISNSTVGAYTYVLNTRMTSPTGTFCIMGEKQIWEGNRVQHCYWLADSTNNSQGIFTRGFTYINENEFIDNGKLGGGADGELVCTESYTTGAMMHGNIVSCEGKTIYVDPALNSAGQVASYGLMPGNEAWSNAYNYSTGWNIIITHGRGMGQLRTIKSFNAEERSLELYDEWDIVPDETSVFTVIVATQAMSVYNNYGSVSSKGWWMYNSCYNVAVVKNYSIDCQGALTRGIKDDVGSSVRPSYFVRMEGNVSEGFSTKSRTNGIGIQAVVIPGSNASDEACVIYAAVIRDNIARGGDTIPSWANHTEAPKVNGIYVMYSAEKAMSNAIDVLRGIIVENNCVEDMDAGITIGSELTDKLAYKDGTVDAMSTNVFLKGNTFHNVQQELNDPRSEAVTIPTGFGR